MIERWKEIKSKFYVQEDLLYKVGHCQNVRIIFIRLRFLRIERINTGFHEHVCKYKILETRDSSQATGFIVILNKS